MWKFLLFLLTFFVDKLDSTSGCCWMLMYTKFRFLYRPEKVQQARAGQLSRVHHFDHRRKLWIYEIFSRFEGSSSYSIKRQTWYSIEARQRHGSRKSTDSNKQLERWLRVKVDDRPKSSRKACHFQSISGFDLQLGLVVHLSLFFLYKCTWINPVSLISFFSS